MQRKFLFIYLKYKLIAFKTLCARAALFRRHRELYTTPPLAAFPEDSVLQTNLEETKTHFSGIVS